MTTWTISLRSRRSSAASPGESVASAETPDRRLYGAAVPVGQACDSEASSAVMEFTLSLSRRQLGHVRDGNQGMKRTKLVAPRRLAVRSSRAADRRLERSRSRLARSIEYVIDAVNARCIRLTSPAGQLGQKPKGKPKSSGKLTADQVGAATSSRLRAVAPTRGQTATPPARPKKTLSDRKDSSRDSKIRTPPKQRRSHLPPQHRDLWADAPMGLCLGRLGVCRLATRDQPVPTTPTIGVVVNGCLDRRT